MSNLDLKLTLTADGKGFTGVVRASKEQVDQLNQSARASGEAGKAGARGLDQMEQSGQGVVSMMRQLNPLVASLVGALSARQLASYADGWSDLTSRVRLNIATHEDAGEVMDRLASIARGTYSSLEASAQGFALNSVTLRAMGRSTQEQLDYTAALNNALVVSGTTSAQFVMVQNSLNRALAEGVVRGQELQNVLNYGSRVAELLADELGTNVTQLRALAADGKITGDILYNTLVRNMELLADEADSMPATIEDAFVILRNSLLQTIGVMDQQRGVSASLAEAIIGVADNIDILVDVAGAAALLLAARFAGSASTAAAAMIVARVEAVRYQAALAGMAGVSRTAAAAQLGLASAVRGASASMAILGGPVGVATIAAGAIYYFRDSIFSARDEASAAVQEIDKLADSFRDLTSAQIDSERQNIAARIRENNAAIAEARLELERLQEQYSNRRSDNRFLPGGARPLLDITSRQSDIAELIRQNEALEAALESLAQREADLAERTARSRRQQAEATEKSVQSIIDALNQELYTLQNGERAWLARRLQLEGATSAQIENALSIYDTSQAIRAERDELERLTNAVDSLLDTVDPLREFARQWEVVQQALARGMIDERQAQAIMDHLVDAGEKGGDKAAEELADRFRQASERIASGLQNAIISGDWGGIGATVGGALAGGIAGAVSSQVAEQFASAAAGAILGPVVGAVAGGLVGLAANAVAKYFRDDWDPTEARQASQGTGSVLGSINAKSESIAHGVSNIAVGTDQLVGINRDMLMALRGLQAGISGASTLIARGAGGVDFGVRTGSHLSRSQQVGVGMLGAAGLAPGGLAMAGVFGQGLDFADRITLGLFSSIGKALGGKTRQVDEGINVLGGSLAELIDGAVIEAYGTFRTRSNAFSRSRTREQTQRLSSEVERQFQAVFGSIWDSVEAGALALRLAPGDVQRALDEFVIETQRISLEGLDAAAQHAEIEAVFGKIFDDLAGSVVPFLDQFQRAGEGLGETLARVASQSQVTEKAARRLGFQFADLSGVELAAVSDRLTELAGGVSDFVDVMEGFIRNFASEGRQFAIYADDITRALAQQGMALPATRDGYWALMQAQDATTQAGAENIATLLRLQGAADRYYSLLERRQSESLARQESLINTRLREAESASRAISQALSGLTAGMPGTGAMRRDTAMRDLRRMVDAGVVRDGDALTGALAAATRIDMAEFASFNDYLREVAATGAVLSDLDAITREQVAVEERMLTVLDRQYQLTVEGQEKQIKALESIEHAVVRSAPVVVQAGASGGAGASATQYRELIAEVRSLRQQLDSSQSAIARHTQRSARTLERIEMDGVEVRQ